MLRCEMHITVRDCEYIYIGLQVSNTFQFVPSAINSAGVFLQLHYYTETNCNKQDQHNIDSQINGVLRNTIGFCCLRPAQHPLQHWTISSSSSIAILVATNSRLFTQNSINQSRHQSMHSNHNNIEVMPNMHMVKSQQCQDMNYIV